MRQAFCALLLLTVSTFAAPAGADPIRVTEGYVQWDYGDPWVFALRAAGFEAVTRPTVAATSGMFTDPRSFCPDIRPCAPGTPFSLNAQYSGAYLDSGIFQGDFSRAVYFDGVLDFAAGTGAVPGQGWVDSPFTFAGTLLGFDNPERSGTPLFSQALVGAGRASVYFQETPIAGATGSSVWFLKYSFEDSVPVPEPGTLLLVATGALAIARRRLCAGRQTPRRGARKD